MNSNLYKLYSSDSPNIGTTDIYHDNEEGTFIRMKQSVLDVQNLATISKVDSITWKMNNEVLSGPRFLIVTFNTVS